MKQESCLGGRLTRYFSFRGTTEGLKKFFPTLRPARTYNDLTNPPGNGVLALPDGDEVVVRIDGPCPNFSGGICRLKDECIKST